MITISDLTPSTNRLPSRKRVGLALGGGVVRGLAHIGVLSVLEDYGVPIDCISGTSVGALIGAYYAAGVNASQLREIARSFNWWVLARPILSRHGFFTFKPMRQKMERELGKLDFTDLKIPLAVVSTDILNGVAITLEQGSVAWAVQSSCSVPGVFAPVELGGRLLCDGGASNMLPVDVLRTMGADYIIAVDIFPFALRPYLGPFRYLFAAVEMLLRHAGGGIQEADCVISPALSGKTYIRFSKCLELIELGRRATEEKIAEICRALDVPGKGLSSERRAGVPLKVDVR